MQAVRLAALPHQTLGDSVRFAAPISLSRLTLSVMTGW